MYFTIVLHYTIGDVHKWNDYRLAGYIDYCYLDKISRFEIVSMTKELNLDVEGCKFLWMDLMSDKMGMTEIKDDADALVMAQSVDLCKVVNNYAKITMVVTPSCTIASGGIVVD